LDSTFQHSGEYPVEVIECRIVVLNQFLNLNTSVRWAPDAMPTESEWQDARLREVLSAGWMLWEAEPTAEIRARLRQFGVQSAVVEPCANRPTAGDLLRVMSDNTAAIERIVQPVNRKHALGCFSSKTGKHNRPMTR
jgi:hypothetical protein